MYTKIKILVDTNFIYIYIYIFTSTSTLVKCSMPECKWTIPGWWPRLRKSLPILRSILSSCMSTWLFGSLSTSLCKKTNSIFNEINVTKKVISSGLIFTMAGWCPILWKFLPNFSGLSSCKFSIWSAGSMSMSLCNMTRILKLAFIKKLLLLSPPLPPLIYFHNNSLIYLIYI